MLKQITAAALWVLAAPLWAQTGPELLLKPWPQERAFESDSSATFVRDGTSGLNDYEARLTLVQSAGRVRIMPGNLVSPRLGYDFTFIDVDSHDPRLPEKLWNQSIAVGTAVGQYQGWVAGLTVGAGYSGDAPFGNDNGWYPKATLGIGRELGKDSLIGIAIDFDGNRSLYPDIPLVGVEYAFRLDPTIRMVLGLPLSSITWTPNPDIEIQGTYTLPDNIGVTAAWQFVPHLWVYGHYLMYSQTFHMDGLPGNDRLFFEQNRAEVGLRFRPLEQVSGYAGVGYAFGQSFSTGWNAGEADGLADLSDEPYLRVGLTIDY